MTSVQSDGSDSTGPGQTVLRLKATQYDNCKACPFGGDPTPLNRFRAFDYDYEAVKESAERGNCQTCTGMVKFFTAQKLEPTTLHYSNSHSEDGTELKLRLAGGESMGYTYTYEFFVKLKEPAEEGITNLDLYPALYLNLESSENACLVIPRLRAPSGDTSSKAAFDTLEQWISNCEEYHEQCNTRTYNGMPHRVLEIMSNEPLRIRLVENCMQREEYACLSHRWAKQTKQSSLKKRNLDLYKTEVPEDKLYPLVRDAIVATSRLGLRFIWIDCYCIIQDDIKDWETEAAEMAKIYENACFTLSATSAQRGHSMFSNMPREFEAFQVTKIRGEPIYIRPRFKHPVGISWEYGEILNGQLLRRAWVFQERVLSHRFVHFTSNEIFWECRESTWCECNSRSLAWSSHRMSPRTLGEQDWQSITHQYIKTQLTFEKDRLPALAGVAQRYSELRGGWTYLAGLWKEQLLSDLTWYKEKGREERPREQVAPTWSWASLPLGGGLQTTLFCGSMPLVECRIIPHDADVYSGVKRIEITVEGPLLDLVVYKKSDEFLIGRHKEGFFDIQADFKTDPDDNIKYRAVRNGSSCRLLLLFEDDSKPTLQDAFGILLQEANGDICAENEKFERIGCITPVWFEQSFVDLYGEYAGYRGGDLPPPADDEQLPDYMEIEWLLDRAKTERVTLV